MKTHSRKMNLETGGILVLAAPLLFALLLLTAAALTIGAYFREKAISQTALDISLVGAARELCISEICWMRVREFAFNSLKENLPNKELNFVNLSDVDENGYPKTKWEHNGFKIGIERGRWLPQSGFESLEGEWIQDNPEISREVVAFSVRISISYPIEAFFKGILPVALQVSSEGIATANTPSDAWVLPYLALPVCALDKTNEGGVCQADRFFSGAGEFYETDPRIAEKYLILPQTDYNFIDQYHYNSETNFPKLFNNLIVDKQENTLESCFYPTPWFEDRYDSVGAIGALGNQLVTENLVQSLALGGTLVKARIGDSFSLLSTRATDPNTAKIIWDEITNASMGNTTDATHRPISETTDLEGIAKNRNLLLFSETSKSECLDKKNRKFEEYFRHPASFLLSSFRSVFGMHDEFQARTDSDGTCSYEDDKFQLPQLTVNIPLIAARLGNGGTCNGNLQELDPSKAYVVVGFVPIKFFDVGKRIRNINDVQYQDNLVSACSNISSSNTILNSLPSNLNPFLSSPIQDGYVIRGRVDCTLRVTGSGIGGTGINRPVLIN